MYSADEGDYSKLEKLIKQALDDTKVNPFVNTVIVSN